MKVAAAHCECLAGRRICGCRLVVQNAESSFFRGTCPGLKEGYPQLFNSFCGNTDEGQFYELGVLGGVDFRSIPESENELKS